MGVIKLFQKKHHHKNQEQEDDDIYEFKNGYHKAKNVLDSLSEYEMKLRESQNNLALIQQAQLQNDLIMDTRTDENLDDVEFVIPKFRNNTILNTP